MPSPSLTCASSAKHGMPPPCTSRWPIHPTACCPKHGPAGRHGQAGTRTHASTHTADVLKACKAQQTLQEGRLKKLEGVLAKAERKHEKAQVGAAFGVWWEQHQRLAAGGNGSSRLCSQGSLCTARKVIGGAGGSAAGVPHAPHLTPPQASSAPRWLRQARVHGKTWEGASGLEARQRHKRVKVCPPPLVPACLALHRRHAMRSSPVSVQVDKGRVNWEQAPQRASWAPLLLGSETRAASNHQQLFIRAQEHAPG